EKVEELCDGYQGAILKTCGATYAFDSKGRMLTGVQVIDYQFYVFNSGGKLNSTKTNRLRKASAYESDASTLISLLEQYGATLKATNYYGSSCYGNGEDGEMVYDTFTIYIFKYASTGKIIVFSVE
ncbi:MAG: hypothetical protein LUF30_02990, partial [Lachnospiraceae bacterium]|nr:hypothetical protein [Lachnospiraceae bacterium]